jgi:hypothetical protein
MSDNELMSLNEAVRALDWKGPDARRRLRRHIESRERELGTRILTRHTNNERQTLRVTRAALRDAFPEWFNERDDQLAHFARRIENSIDDRVTKEVGEVWKAINSLRSDLNTLRDLVRAGAAATRIKQTRNRTRPDDSSKAKEG